MCYPPALSAESQMLLQQLLPKSKRIEVEKKDACDFACNAIALESTLVLNRASESLKERLLQSGFSTVECRVDQFIRAGGAAKCLALFLDNC